MFRVTREIEFCYGHRLLNYDGKCRYLHGHNGLAVIAIEGAELDHRGMLVDFSDIKTRGQHLDRRQSRPPHAPAPRRPGRADAPGHGRAAVPARREPHGRKHRQADLRPVEASSICRRRSSKCGSGKRPSASRRTGASSSWPRSAGVREPPKERQIVAGVEVSPTSSRRPPRQFPRPRRSGDPFRGERRLTQSRPETPGVTKLTDSGAIHWRPWSPRLAYEWVAKPA